MFETVGGQGGVDLLELGQGPDGGRFEDVGGEVGDAFCGSDLWGWRGGEVEKEGRQGGRMSKGEVW